MEGFRRSGRLAGASPKLLGNAAHNRERRRKSKGAEREGKAMPAVEETWQGFPSFVCLAQGCSARGNQETSRRGGGGGGGGGGALGQALPRLRKQERKSSLKRAKTRVHRALWKWENKTRDFLFYELCSRWRHWTWTGFRR